MLRLELVLICRISCHAKLETVNHSTCFCPCTLSLPDHGAEMGKGEHRQVRRGPRQGDNIRGGLWRGVRDPDGHVPPGPGTLPRGYCSLRSPREHATTY